MEGARKYQKPIYSKFADLGGWLGKEEGDDVFEGEGGWVDTPMHIMSA